MKQDQQPVWDAIAKQWFHFRQRPFRDVEKWLDELTRKTTKVERKQKVLGVGCGNCRNLLPFAKAGFDCYGIDFSKKMLKYARLFCKKHNIKVKLKQADATKLPFKNNMFDYVLCIAVLHHLKRQQQKKALQEIRRVLKPKGLALITVWNKWHKRFWFKPKQLYIIWHIAGKPYYRYYYLFNFFELNTLLKKNGFKIIKSNRFFGIAQKNLTFLIEKI
jgi:ubiquinone/menaquinone biosynthesis C-methylase UbiE